ncbi:MAG: helix-turn-helix domain-containing protein [Methanomethylophilus sp.]
MFYNRIVLDSILVPGKKVCRNLLPFDITDDMDTRVINCSFVADGVGHSIIRILTDGKKELPEGHTETPWGECSVTRFSSTHYTAVVLNRTCNLCAVVNQNHCFLLSSILVDKDHVEWMLVGADSRSVHKCVDAIRELGCHVRFVAGGNFSDQMALTPKEERYLAIAYEQGLYDVPRRIDLNGLCKIVGCSKSTLNVILRTAERKVISRYTTESVH